MILLEYLYGYTWNSINLFKFKTGTNLIRLGDNKQIFLLILLMKEHLTHSILKGFQTFSILILRNYKLIHELLIIVYKITFKQNKFFNTSTPFD